MADQNKPESIIFEIGVDGHPEEPVTASLFAFDSRGEMLAVGVLTEGVATLAVSPDQLRRARLLVAPVSPGRGDAPPTLDMLERLNPYEPTWEFSPDRLAYQLLPVPEFHWRHWYWCSCRVRGKVIKVESSGGVTYENPVCHARVHVCEVDRIPWVIERLPDDILLRVRDELLWAIEHPAPIRDLCEKPFPVDPGNIDPVPVTVRASELLLSADATLETINLQPLPVNRYPLQLESHAALNADSIGIVRRALIDHVSLIRIFWCDWDWLWPWFRSNCDELTVVETDQNGRFDTTIWYPCFGDRPDLYFWVEYSIGETWTTVYNPSIRCNTYWDYACGTDVTIRVTDPRVRGCRDRPELLGMKLVVKTIGRQVSMGEIYPDQTDPKACQV